MVAEDTVNKKVRPEYGQEGESLGHRAVKGGMWMVTLRIVHRGLGLCRTLILARLLSPQDFGLFGIALLTINFLENFSATGIIAALVQKRESIDDYLDSAWTVSLARALLLFSILYFGAPAIAHFFDSPGALDVVRALAFIQVLVGAENIGTLFFQKEIRFDKLFYLNFSGMMVNVAASITMAFILKSVWALVYGALAGAAVKTLMSYVLHPYRPAIRFDLAKIKELLRFGKWLFGSSILVFLITEGDDAFVGKILGATALGFYQIAYQLSNAPATEISNFVAQLTFPVYSKIQDNLARLREAYFRVLQLVAFISFPLSGLIFLLAPDFTRLFLGEKWLPMVSAMQVLTLWGLTRAIGTTTTQVFYAVGKPDLSVKVKLAQLLLIIVAIYPLTAKWGILGTSLAIVGSTLIPNIAACYLAVKIIQGSVKVFGKALLLPLINTVTVIAVILIAKMWWQTSVAFFIHIVIGLLVYMAVTNLFNHFFDYDMWFVLRKVRQEMKK